LQKANNPIDNKLQVLINFYALLLHNLTSNLPKNNKSLTCDCTILAQRKDMPEWVQNLV